MKSAVIIFPGSNCDRDIIVALERTTGRKPHLIWHKETSIPDVDLVALPGGFTYGDYLRPGAMAARSPVMKSVIEHGNRGGFLLGICNGFQVLTETQLLPGALVRNRNLKFICKTVHLKPANTATFFTSGYQSIQPVRIPVAHHDGSYYIDKDGLKGLNDNEQIAFQYCDADGNINDTTNINGSIANIAGVYNRKGNILGLMPHPERAIDPLHGGTDGKIMFDSILKAISS